MYIFICICIYIYICAHVRVYGLYFLCVCRFAAGFLFVQVDEMVQFVSGTCARRLVFLFSLAIPMPFAR